jgi:hypothetical protein
MSKSKVKNEQKLRDSFEQTRGSMEGWSSEPTPAKVSKGVGIVFSVRFSSEELKSIRRRAAALGTNVSGLIRRAVLDESVHQPAHVYSISIVDAPMLAVFGNATTAFVCEGGQTTVTRYGGMMAGSTPHTPSWMSTSPWLCIPEKTNVGPITPMYRDPIYASSEWPPPFAL